jgi:hypothetical protein
MFLLDQLAMATFLEALYCQGIGVVLGILKMFSEFE